MRFRNTLLIAVLALVMLGPAGMFAAKAASIELPEFLDPATAEYLEGGKETVDLGEALSPTHFIDGQLQDGIDTAIANNIPAKAPVLFANAALQRSAIEASNALYQWPCYLTFYNSEYLVDSEYGAVVAYPYTDEVDPDGLVEFSRVVNDYAARNPQMEIELLIVDRACTSASNVASSLVSNPFVTQEVFDIMDELCTEPNIKVASTSYDTRDEFFKDYFKSDHHWNVRGVMKGLDALYGDLPETDPIRVSLDAIKKAGERRVDGPNFSGSCTRNGLYSVEDDPQVFAYDFPDMVVSNGGEEYLGVEHATYDDATSLNKHYQFYDLYYKGGTQATGSGMQNALLISDSFGSAFQWPLSACYSTLWTSNDLHFYSETDDTLGDLCDLPNCQKLVFVGCVLNYSNFLQRNPHIFET